MTTPANVVSYFGASAQGLPFGVIDKEHPTGHKGQDLVHAAGSAIPALLGGVVDYVAYSSVLGHVIEIKVAPGVFLGYCHTVQGRVSVGYELSQGEILAYVAGYNDDHGSAWNGPHTHFTQGWVRTSVLGFDVVDPLPLIAQVLSQASGGDGRPIPPPPTPTLPEEDNMNILILRYLSAVPNRWIILDMLAKTYRVLAPGSYEDQVLTARVVSGELEQKNISDPEWGNTFGNGQYRNIG